MWQIVDNSNIMATIHFVEFSKIELDVEPDPKDSRLDTVLPGKIQRSIL